MNILVINGPNLNLLGERQPAIYGTTTLDELERSISDHAYALGMRVRFFQSNHEGAIVDELHRRRRWAQGIVINPGALTHYSYAIRDALASVAIPTVEVHLTDVDHREPFRAISVIRDVCIERFVGGGAGSYFDALDALAKVRPAPSPEA